VAALVRLAQVAAAGFPVLAGAAWAVQPAAAGFPRSAARAMSAQAVDVR